ncbi:hypothetical protein GOBAR_AA22432 [Gossypium barbadense]|uniref:Uncharacterized protein n=1 Tax=Gossypium barbadense TaxID=3634 RepID=A0A2P5X4I7_GOSBA|nr:hypothetical protein GOBAR_AA22432 [Gossypium barbadense]
MDRTVEYEKFDLKLLIAKHMFSATLGLVTSVIPNEPREAYIVRFRYRSLYQEMYLQEHYKRYGKGLYQNMPWRVRGSTLRYRVCTECTLERAEP